jgi:hypothetical protein
MFPLRNLKLKQQKPFKHIFSLHYFFFFSYIYFLDWMPVYKSREIEDDFGTHGVLSVPAGWLHGGNRKMGRNFRTRKIALYYCSSRCFIKYTMLMRQLKAFI